MAGLNSKAMGSLQPLTNYDFAKYDWAYAVRMQVLKFDVSHKKTD